ncbi:MAG TPA: LysR family transcriptional regulator [Labilithrix sp.]|nr:LysR family transcriptional regulator [Labilithrix sp.]
MELRHLRYFVAVAEERHFGRAAERVRIAQPPLSRQIQALEEELGVRLFDRSRRKVELTAAGTTLLDHARRVFAAVELATRETLRASRGERGRIAIGYPSSLAYSGLPELLRAFRAKFPEVEVALSELSPQAQIEALKDGRLDVGFVRAPFDDPALASMLVRREPLVVAMPADHPLASRKRIALGLLAEEPFVSFPRSRGPAFFDQLMRLCHDAGFTPRVAQEAQQLDLVSLVSAGFGVAIVPSSVRHVRRAGVVYRSIIGAPKSDLRIAWKKDSGAPIVRELVEVVRRVGVRRPRSARWS